MNNCLQCEQCKLERFKDNTGARIRCTAFDHPKQGKIITWAADAYQQIKGMEDMPLSIATCEIKERGENRIKNMKTKIPKWCPRGM